MDSVLVVDMLSDTIVLGFGGAIIVIVVCMYINLQGQQIMKINSFNFHEASSVLIELWSFKPCMSPTGPIE